MNPPRLETVNVRHLTPEEKAELEALRNKPDRTVEETWRFNTLVERHNHYALAGLEALRQARKNFEAAERRPRRR